MNNKKASLREAFFGRLKALGIVVRAGLFIYETFFYSSSGLGMYFLHPVSLILPRGVLKKIRFLG
ncbi:MAG: hypothetical protein KAQ63_03105, partial [Candidatus Moranbacteria bacterium]|nr:hypothetical protein [Candidatus Moranbacteria bacterium]